MKILNFGSANIDYVYSLNHIVLAGETQTSSNMNIFPGGKGLNQSVALARAGADVYHAGCFGTDAGILIDLLRKSGADVSLAKRVDIKNGHAIIQVSADGENSIIICSGSNAMITESYVDDVLKNFDRGEFILLQNEINNVEYIIKSAFEKGLNVILNPSPVNQNLKNIDLNMLSYLVLNEVEAKDMGIYNGSTEDIKNVLNTYPNLTVVLTLGKNGSVLCNKDCKIFSSAYNVKTVDTTAAGDTFTGFFIAMTANGENYENSLKTASAAAALAVSKNGAAPSIPNLADVLKFIDTFDKNH